MAPVWATNGWSPQPCLALRHPLNDTSVNMRPVGPLLLEVYISPSNFIRPPPSLPAASCPRLLQGPAPCGPATFTQVHPDSILPRDHMGWRCGRELLGARPETLVVGKLTPWSGGQQGRGPPSSPHEGRPRRSLFTRSLGSGPVTTGWPRTMHLSVGRPAAPAFSPLPACCHLGSAPRGRRLDPKDRSPQSRAAFQRERPDAWLGATCFASSLQP